MSILTQHTNPSLYLNEALSASSYALLIQIADKCSYRKARVRLLMYLECLLQLTNKKLSVGTFHTPDFNVISNTFLGAINSEKFLKASLQTRYCYSISWIQILTRLSKTNKFISVPSAHISAVSTSEGLQTLVSRFERMNLNEEKLQYWTGWFLKSSSGYATCIPLQSIYRKYGEDFTSKLYSACKLYFSTRRAGAIPGLKEFIHFLTKLEINEFNFNCEVSMSKFWHMFLTYFLEESALKKMPIENAKRDWSLFSFFVRKYLNLTTLFVSPFNGLPTLRSTGRKKETNVHVTTNNIKIHERLLTDVPFDITDADAIQQICESIKQDFEIILTWAKWSTEEIWSRYQNLQNAAMSVEPLYLTEISGKNNGKQWKKCKENPLHLNYAAATFKHYGFQCSRDVKLTTIYPTPLSLTKRYLALPDVPHLNAFAILLIADAPCITHSFIEGFELFDKNGKQTGLVDFDNTSIITGYKLRKKFVHAQQIIPLSENATTLVERLIKITDPIRSYLREKGDDNWRKLFLTCSSGFGYPRGLTTSSGSNAKSRFEERYIEEIQLACNVSYLKSQQLVKRLSLSTVRATAGTVTYLKNNSVFEMATALGHESYRSSLLDRYLPRSISDYFRTRTIRIFHMALIAQALGDDPLLGDALNLSPETDLKKFQEIHGLNIESENRNDYHTPTNKKTEVIFGVNREILVDLIGITNSDDRSIAPKERQIAGALLYSIQERSKYRPDLFTLLTSARQEWSERR